MMNLREQEEKAAAHFRDIVRDHQMEILHHEGLYRHVRFKRPDSTTYWFDLVTWPGYLAINGDLVSGYTFTRTRDMFSFFASGPGINPQYWAEKITCPTIELRKFDEDVETDFDVWEEGRPWLWDHSYLLSCHAIRWGVEQWTQAANELVPEAPR
jgi:hypothetical protein